MLDGLAAGGAHSTLGGPWGRPRSCPTQEDPSARRGPVLERQEADAGARGDPPARTRHRLWVGVLVFSGEASRLQCPAPAMNGSVGSPAGTWGSREVRNRMLVELFFSMALRNPQTSVHSVIFPVALV